MKKTLEDLKEPWPIDDHVIMNKVPFEKYENSNTPKTPCIENDMIKVNSGACQACEHFHGAWIMRGYILCSLENNIGEKETGKEITIPLLSDIADFIDDDLHSSEVHVMKPTCIGPTVGATKSIIEINDFEAQCRKRLTATGMSDKEIIKLIAEAKEFSKKTRGGYFDVLEMSVMMAEEK